MREEAEALMHASKGLNTALKTSLALLIVVIISVIQYGVTNGVINGMESARFWVAMLIDSVSLTFPLIALGLYTRMTFQAVEIWGSLPFLLMIFLSTSFSPGAGVPVLKELRYAFTRFYFWCMVPGVEDLMEGCPNEGLNFALLVITGLMGIPLFILYYAAVKAWNKLKMKKMNNQMRKALMDAEFNELQLQLYGEKKMRQFRSADEINFTSHEINSTSPDGRVEVKETAIEYARVGGEDDTFEEVTEEEPSQWTIKEYYA